MLLADNVISLIKPLNYNFLMKLKEYFHINFNSSTITDHFFDNRMVYSIATENFAN